MGRETHRMGRDHPRRPWRTCQGAVQTSPQGYRLVAEVSFQEDLSAVVRGSQGRHWQRQIWVRFGGQMQEGREWPPSFSHSLAPSWYLTYLGTTPTIINAMFPIVLVQFYVTSVIPLYYCLKCNMSTCHWKQSLPSRAPALRTMNPAAAQLQKGKGIFSVHGVSRASGDWSQTRFKPSSRYDFT